MALEKSVLTHETISMLLQTHYAINIVEVHRLKLGSANCYRVYDGQQYYFLKEFQSGFEQNDLICEYQLVNYLSENNFPVARFILTVTGEPFFTYQNHLICLEEYIEGTMFGYSDFPKSMLNKVARTLGKLHHALKDYILPIDMGEDWVNAYSATSHIEKYDALLNIANQNPKDKYYTQILLDLNYKKELATRCEEYKNFYKDITYLPTHGDFQGCQLICENDNIKAVIDFSSARTLPIVWEIMRSFVQSSIDCRKTATVNIDELYSYVKEYMRFFPLTKKDLISMPYVYLFQLARSSYGYPQYLTTDSEDRDELLQFALWRTDICRELEKKAPLISSMLSQL